MYNSTNYSASSTVDNSNPNHDTNFEKVNIIYTCYRELCEYSENVELLILIRSVSDQILEPTLSWAETFHAITELRRIRKFYPDLFEHIFNNLSHTLSGIFIQSNTPISRNILKLSSEIFIHQDYSHSVSDWMENLLPTVLVKSISEIKIVAEEANEVLENFVQNVFYPKSIEILLENVSNKNTNISNKSFDYLMKLLYNFDAHSFANISECIDWEHFIDNLYILCENKKETYITKAFKILDFIDEIFRIIQIEENLNIFGRILSQNESLEFNSKFEALNMAREKFLSIKYKKQEHFGNLKATRHSIKSDKRRSGGGINHFWSNGQLDENRNNELSQFERIDHHQNY